MEFNGEKDTAKATDLREVLKYLESECEEEKTVSA